jgi:hypothetical protein
VNDGVAMDIWDSSKKQKISHTILIFTLDCMAFEGFVLIFYICPTNIWPGWGRVTL